MNHYLQNKIRKVIEDTLYKHRLYESTLTSITLLLEDFKSQKAKYISQGYDERIVDEYLDYFKQIKDKKYKQAKDVELPGVNVPTGNARYDIDSYKTFRELEILVDYVRGQRDVKSSNFTDIEIDGKPIFENSDVEIYYADSPEACIKYKGDKPYSWCISRPKYSGNMYYSYRFNSEEPAFYFVKRKKATEEEFKFWNLSTSTFSGQFQDKYHFFVIQVVGTADTVDENKYQYTVTSAKNDGDKNMNWNQILKVAPELRGLNKIFEPKPFTPEERERIDKYKEGLSGKQYMMLPYEEKKYYMDITINRRLKLSDEQFKATPEDLQNHYIGLAVGLTDGQFNLIKSNSKLVKRYEEITIRKYEELLKDNPGMISKFTSSEEEIIINYFKRISPTQIKEKLDVYIESGQPLFDGQFAILSYDLKAYYLQYGGHISDNAFDFINADRNPRAVQLVEDYKKRAFLKFRRLLEQEGSDVYFNNTEILTVKDYIKTLPLQKQIELYTHYFERSITDPHMEVDLKLTENERRLANAAILPKHLVKTYYIYIANIPEFKSLSNLRAVEYLTLNNLPNLKSLGELKRGVQLRLFNLPQLVSLGKVEAVSDLYIENLPQFESLGELKLVFEHLSLTDLPNLKSLGKLEEASKIVMWNTYLSNNYTVEELEKMYPQFKGKIKIENERLFSV